MKTKWLYEAEVVRFLEPDKAYLNIDLGFHEWRFILVVIKNLSDVEKPDLIFGKKVYVQIRRIPGERKALDTYEARIQSIDGKSIKKSTKETQAKTR